jgi:ATP-dependent DNA helicase RecQ
MRPPVHRRFHDIGELFANGQGLEQIARRYGVSRKSVIDNLSRFWQDGGRLDPQRILAESRLDESDRARVLALFERLGTERLAPIHEALSGQIDYDELHLLRLCLIRTPNTPL